MTLPTNPNNLLQSIAFGTYQSPAFISIAAARRQQRTHGKLESFLRLEQGWHFGEGIPPTNALVQKMLKANSDIYRFGFAKTDAFPRINGGILLSAYHDDYVIDFSAEPNGGAFALCVEQSGQGTFDQDPIDFRFAIQIIEFLGKIWISFGQSIPDITQKMKIALKAKHSRRHQMDLEYPSSNANVQLGPLVEYVRTSTATMYPSVSPAPLRSTG